MQAFGQWRVVFAFATLFGALAVVYGPLIRADPLLERDDQRLVAPLTQVGSLRDYLDAVASGRILDRQPVRDLSFVVDLKLSALTGVGTFHLTNLLLWFGLVLTVYATLRASRPAGALLLLCVAAFALHPVFVGSVGWVSARKHLLAGLFCLLATAAVVRSPGALGWRRLLAIAGLYALSVASQPITLLWPGWAAAHLLLSRPARRRDAALVVAGCLPALIACAAVNLAYYQGAYVAQGGAEKFVEGEATGGVALLALGRYFANLVFPSALATQYDVGAWLNPLGLLALVLFAAATLKWRARRLAIAWLAYFLFPLLVVTVRMTAIFVSDTYLVTAGVGVLGLLLLWLPERPSAQASRALGAGLVAVVAVCFVLSLGQAHSWTSDAALWEHAARVEPTPNALAKHAYHLAGQGRTREAIDAATRLGAWDPGHREYPYVFARAVFLDRAMRVEDKLRLISTVKGGWPAYFAGSLLASKGSYPEANARMRQALATPEVFKAELSVVTAEAQVICARAGEAGCEAAAQALRARAGLPWNEAAFLGRLKQLER